ncbi:MAG: DUF2007 domain-containing protein [Eubacterium sp.]|nr:DUF2007 domain-containing protein [Eubacterium sp.]
MERFEDRYAFLKMAYTDMELTMTKNFLEANGIPVTVREKGFGGPIRSIFMGRFMPANIEIFVNPEDLAAARELLQEDFSELVDEEWGDDDV